MKILMLGWELPPHFVGGMGIASYQLCQHLAQTGADIEFILPFDAEFDIDFMKVNPVKEVSYDDLLTSGSGVYAKSSIFKSVHMQQGAEEIHQRFYEKTAKIAKLGEFEVIHAHDWMTFKAGLAAKRISGKPLIVHVHATEFDRAGSNTGNPLVHEIEYLGMSLADKIIAVSAVTKKIIVEKYKIDPAKIEVVHNSIDLSSKHLESKNDTNNEYTYLSEMKSRGYKIIGNIGRMTMQKGLTHLLQAAQLALQADPKLLFLMVGAGDQRDELILRSAELGIAENVLFVDFQNGKKLKDAYRICDLFVMPSVSEPFGLTAMEAIGLGVPTLISNQSGVGEILNNVLKVDYWDIRKMADQMVAVANTESLGNMLKEKASIEFSKQSWHKSARKTRRVYDMATGVAA